MNGGIKKRSNLKISWRFFLCFLAIPFCLFAQETEEKNWALQGYVKSMQGLFFIDFPGFSQQTITDNFLHNRLNFNWFPSDNWTYRMGLRTRFFYGEFTRLNPSFQESLDEGGNDILNLSLLNIGDKVILHSIVDRAYFQYNRDKLEIRFGRQRINWGINTLWNPNDLFNAFAFTDFDYEERPGSDALRLQYYTGYAGSIELAIKAFDDTNEIVAAGLYKFNKWNYDFQLLAGWSKKDIVLGGGWAGNIKNAGFKGEFSWFNAVDEATKNAFAATISLDYAFSNSLFWMGGVLYNLAAVNTANTNIFAFELSARNLYPFEWSVFSSVSYPITPLLSTSVALIYSPVTGHPLFANPTLTYSLAQNLDADLVGQFIFQNSGNGYGSNTQVFYLRIKWSF